MKIQNNLRLAAALGLTTSLLAFSANATEVNVNASVVVNNAIDVAVVAPLDFGSVAAFSDGGDTTQASLKIPADGTAPVITATNTALSNIISLTDGTPADIMVTGAAPGYDLNVTATAAVTTLTNPAEINSMTFEMSAFNFYAYQEGNNQTFGKVTDAAGALGLNIGATITTTDVNAAAASGNQAYVDGTYTGTFEVNVDY